MVIETGKAGGELELSRGEQFNPVGRIVARANFVEFGDVDFVAPQVELAVITGLSLKFERPIEIARPDMETTVAVADQNRVVDGNAVGKAHADSVHRQLGVRVGAEALQPPLLSSWVRLGQNIGHGGRHDGGPLGIQHGVPGGERPTAVGLFDAVVDDDSAVINNAEKIGRGAPVQQRGAAGLRGPSLLQSPASFHGQQVFEAGAGDRLAGTVANRIAGGQGPVAAGPILRIHAPVQ